MAKLKKINLNKEVLDDIVVNLINHVPGISKETKPIVEICQVDVPYIKITIKPIDDITNVYDLCKKIQDLVYYHILTNFDLEGTKVDVLAI